MPVGAPGGPGRRRRSTSSPPTAGLDPGRRSRPRRSTPRPGEKAYEELMTEDESTRALRHRRHVRGPAVDRRRSPRSPTPTATLTAGAGRGVPLGRGRGDVDRRGPTGSSPRPSARQRRSTIRVPHEGPRHRRGRVHRPLGRRRAAGARSRRSCRSTTSSTGDAANLAEFAGHPRPAAVRAVGDVRDAAACRRWAARGRRGRPPRRVDLGPGLDRRPGDDVRERRRRHVQPARGRARRSGPGSCS